MYACTRSVDIQHGGQLGEQLVLSFRHVGFGDRTRQGHQVCWQVPHQPSKPTDLSLLWSAFYFFNPCHSLELMSSSTFPHFVLLILSSRSKLLLPDHPAGSLSFSVVCSIPCAALSVFGVESVLCYFDFPHSLCSAEAVSSLPFSGSTYSLKSFSSDDTSHQLFILPRTSAVNTTQSSCYCHLIF